MIAIFSNVADAKDGVSVDNVVLLNLIYFKQPVRDVDVLGNENTLLIWLRYVSQSSSMGVFVQHMTTFKVHTTNVLVSWCLSCRSGCY
jgi:hypothetical protein